MSNYSLLGFGEQLSLSQISDNSCWRLSVNLCSSGIWVVRVRACILAVARGSACLAYLLSDSAVLGIVAKLLAPEALTWSCNIKIRIKLFKAQPYFLWQCGRLECQEEGSCWLFSAISVDRNSVGFSHKGHVFIPRWGIEGISDLLVGHARCCSAEFCHSLSCIQRPVGGDLHREFTDLLHFQEVTSIGLVRDPNE